MDSQSPTQGYPFGVTHFVFCSQTGLKISSPEFGKAFEQFILLELRHIVPIDKQN
ncbi:MAG: hypothetical protein H7A32_00705 [Deltaproteobacteria bacterium]|nr:hypothetical protein [Deltaproteobacteria bacterium]